MIARQLSKSTLHCPGTRVAPSHQPNTSTSVSKLHNLPHSLTAWDKRQRVGEASKPGPEPPRELYLDRKNGQRDPIRLCTQSGGWVWNVHCVPPLRVAKRSTPHDALRNWLNKHENAIQPESAEAARQLAKEWEAFPMPQPVRRTRSLPPREIQSMTSDASLDNSPPKATRSLTHLSEDASEAKPKLWPPPAVPLASARQTAHMVLRVNNRRGHQSLMDVGMRSMMC